MIKTLIFIGAGGHSKVAIDIAKKMKQWNQIYLLDNDHLKHGQVYLDCKVIGSDELANNYYNKADFFVAIGDNHIRQRWIETLLKADQSLVTLIHPFTSIAEDVVIKKGTIVMAGAVINSGTLVEKGCIVNTSTSIDHDCKIEAYVHLSPNVHLGGTVGIGSCSWIGLGTNIIQNVTVCQNVVVGAGSLVLKDIDEPGKYFGIPVRKSN